MSPGKPTRQTRSRTDKKLENQSSDLILCQKMLQCLSTGICGNCCPCLIKEQYLKNYRRAIKDVRGLTQSKNFIFGQDSSGISFLNFYDHSTKKIIDLKINVDIRNYSGVTMLDPNRMFICGGVNYQMNNVVSHAKIYTISEEKFTILPNMLNIRFNFPILYFKNKIYVTGGRGYGGNDVAITNQCECYDFNLKRWYPIANMNVQRCGHQMFAYKNKIYVIGGLSVDKRVRFLEEYDPNTNNWRITTKSLIFDLYNFEIFSHDLDEILIVGGIHSKGYSNFIHAFNMKQSRIISKGFLKHHRSNFKLFYERSKQRLIFLGGAIPVGSQPTQTYLETFDLINQQSSVVSVNSNLILRFIAKYNYSKTSIILQSTKVKKVKKNSKM